MKAESEFSGACVTELLAGEEDDDDVDGFRGEEECVLVMEICDFVTELKICQVFWFDCVWEGGREVIGKEGGGRHLMRSNGSTRINDDAADDGMAVLFLPSKKRTQTGLRSTLHCATQR